jgi:hypothetical protein
LHRSKNTNHRSSIFFWNTIFVFFNEELLLCFFNETEIESVISSFEDYETNMVGVCGRVKKSGSVKDYVMDWIGKYMGEGRKVEE